MEKIKTWILKIPNWLIVLIFLLTLLKTYINFTSSDIEPGDKLFWALEMLFVGILLPITIYLTKKNYQKLNNKLN